MSYLMSINAFLEDYINDNENQIRINFNQKLKKNHCLICF